jgi:hypothetical protein
MDHFPLYFLWHLMEMVRVSGVCERDAKQTWVGKIFIIFWFIIAGLITLRIQINPPLSLSHLRGIDLVAVTYSSPSDPLLLAMQFEATATAELPTDRTPRLPIRLSPHLSVLWRLLTISSCSLLWEKICHCGSLGFRVSLVSFCQWELLFRSIHQEREWLRSTVQSDRKVGAQMIRKRRSGCVKSKTGELDDSGRPGLVQNPYADINLAASDFSSLKKKQTCGELVVQSPRRGIILRWLWLQARLSRKWAEKFRHFSYA